VLANTISCLLRRPVVHLNLTGPMCGHRVQARPF
jgi:hypothetical protein